MALTEQQKEMLHAWLDGEASTAERAAVEALNQAEVLEYVRQIMALQELLQRHADVPAPADLRLRILDELHTKASVIQLSSWRVPLVSAAAAVLVCLALVFGDLGGSASPDDSLAAGVHADSSHSTAPDAPAEHLRPGSPPSPDPGAVRLPAAVLNLTPGQDVPFEVSLHLDRGRRASVLQVYNDLLMLGSLHGRARVLDTRAAGTWNDSEEFQGFDFTVCAGVEVELNADRVPEFLAAVGRLNGQQEYGQVVLPGYVGAEVEAAGETTRILEDVAERVETSAGDGPSDGANGAQSYLPSYSRLEYLKRSTEGLKLDSRLTRMFHDLSGGPSGAGGEERKARILLHLR